MTIPSCDAMLVLAFRSLPVVPSAFLVVSSNKQHSTWSQYCSSSVNMITWFVVNNNKNMNDTVCKLSLDFNWLTLSCLLEVPNGSKACVTMWIYPGVLFDPSKLHLTQNTKELRESDQVLLSHAFSVWSAHSLLWARWQFVFYFKFLLIQLSSVAAPHCDLGQ